jgi:hypothetical protein
VEPESKSIEEQIIDRMLGTGDISICAVGEDLVGHTYWKKGGINNPITFPCDVLISRLYFETPASRIIEIEVQFGEKGGARVRFLFPTYPGSTQIHVHLQKGEQITVYGGS